MVLYVCFTNSGELQVANDRLLLRPVNSVVVKGQSSDLVRFAKDHAVEGSYLIRDYRARAAFFSALVLV